MKRILCPAVCLPRICKDKNKQKLTRRRQTKIREELESCEHPMSCLVHELIRERTPNNFNLTVGSITNNHTNKH